MRRRCAAAEPEQERRRRRRGRGWPGLAHCVIGSGPQTKPALGLGNAARGVGPAATELARATATLGAHAAAAAPLGHRARARRAAGGLLARQRCPGARCALRQRAGPLASQGGAGGAAAAKRRRELPAAAQREPSAHAPLGTAHRARAGAPRGAHAEAQALARRASATASAAQICERRSTWRWLSAGWVDRAGWLRPRLVTR